MVIVVGLAHYTQLIDDIILLNNSTIPSFYDHLMRLRLKLYTPDIVCALHTHSSGRITPRATNEDEINAEPGVGIVI